MHFERINPLTGAVASTSCDAIACAPCRTAACARGAAGGHFLPIDVRNVCSSCLLAGALIFPVVISFFSASSLGT